MVDTLQFNFTTAGQNVKHFSVLTYISCWTLTNKEGNKMNIFKSMLITSWLFDVNLASLKSCSENQTHQHLCFISNDGYNNPFPVVLDTTLYMNIIEIDGDKNSIKMEIDFWTFWIDHGIGLSNDSSK